VREVDSLKQDMQNLMERIMNTVKSPQYSPEAARIVHGDVVCVKEEAPEQTDAVASPEQQVVNLDLVEGRDAATMTDAELEAAISEAQRQKRELERQNTTLRKQLSELRKTCALAEEKTERLKKAAARHVVAFKLTQIAMKNELLPARIADDAISSP
jgi:UDP-2,3-diacylglucosamine pyrophosphatase LpxH